MNFAQIIAANRDGLTSRVFKVNDEVSFEYWNKHEWEFCINTSGTDEETGRKIVNVIKDMSRYMSTINVSYSRVPQLMALCRARLAS